MVKKKNTPKKRARAAPAKRVYRRRKNSGVTQIPAAMATAGLVLANAGNIKEDLNKISQIGLGKMAKVYVPRGYYKKYMNGGQLVNDALYTVGGMIAGEAVRKYAPTIIKKPLGKIAKKIPKVF